MGLPTGQAPCWCRHVGTGWAGGLETTRGWTDPVAMYTTCSDVTVNRALCPSQCTCAFGMIIAVNGRVQFKCDGTRWRTGGEVRGKLANGVGSQYSSHYLVTWCIQTCFYYQIDAQFLYSVIYIYYIKYLDMFRAPVCSSSGGQNYIFKASGIVTLEN
jgi:hypothetical protein